jgi:hypothetical protein
LIKIQTGNLIMEKFLKENFSTQTDCDAFIRTFFKMYKEEDITEEILENHLDWLNGRYDYDVVMEDD